MDREMFYGAGKEVFQKAEAFSASLTPAEALLWDQLEKLKGEMTFRRKHPAASYVLDFYCHEARVAIEIDESDGASAERGSSDTTRQHTLNGLGIKTLYFSSNQVLNDIKSVMQKIQAETMPHLSNDESVKNASRSSGLEIIPAIDIIDGKCVRLTQGDYLQKTIYHKNPLDVARQFEDAEISRLHLVDLDGAKAGAVKNWKTLEAIAGKTSLVIDFGGGIKTEKDVSIVLESGSTYATIGSIAVKDEVAFTSWLEKFGAGKFILGADVKEEKIAVGGWLETTDIWVYDFIEKYIAKGVQQIFCTDVSKDGKMEGPSIELYKNIVSKFPGLHFIASGGVSSLQDVGQLQEIGCKGVIIGKAIYENKISLPDLKQFLK